MNALKPVRTRSQIISVLPVIRPRSLVPLQPAINRRTDPRPAIDWGQSKVLLGAYMAPLTTSSPLQFRFELEPVDHIAPWGEDDDRKLHWFGLTDGRYWMVTPLGEALRYTDEKMKEWETQSPYVDYQVARFFEDLQIVLPSALEPVPADIAALVCQGGWLEHAEKRMSDLSDAGELREMYRDAMDWYIERSLDKMYLVDGPIFRFWRVGDQVNIRWEPSVRNPDDRWVLPQGEFTITSEQFESAAYSFFHELLNETGKRVAIIEAMGWRRQDCKVDAPSLVREQKQRTDWIGDLKRRQPKTDWGDVRRLVSSVSAELSIPDSTIKR